MKKTHGIPNLPSAVVSFTGDCTRQNALNRTVDRLAHQSTNPLRKDFFAGCGIQPPAQHAQSKKGETLVSILFFVCLIGCAYGVMAL